MNMLTNTEHSTVIKSFEIERLEFGKFCVSPNGPAIMDNGNYVEYSILGKSENFPPELVSSCKRIALKIEENSGGNDSDHFSYGTILRPFLHGGGSPRTVFFKVRQRYEEGETAVRGRQYRLGRFLTARDLEISPFMFFRAMKTLPLEGITLAESNSINSLPVLQNETDNTQISEFFVKKAVAFILSGVPIAISEDISEEDFFKCVSEVRAAYRQDCVLF